MTQSTSFNPEPPEAWRQLLFSVAYKMLGSVGEAEDLAGEIILEWLESPPADPREPRAYAVRMLINRAIDRLKALKRERESYPGVWLPEPIGERQVDVNEFSIGLLRLMEVLNPVERAVFILRNAFDHDFEAIGEFLDKKAANCRKILSRANARLKEERAHLPTRDSRAKALVEEVIAGFERGDMEAVFKLLHREVTLWSDGGGKKVAAMVPVQGAEKVAAFLTAVAGASGGALSMKMVRVNAGPGILVLLNGQAESLFTFEIQEGKVRDLLIQRNPDKLGKFLGF